MREHCPRWNGQPHVCDAICAVELNRWVRAQTLLIMKDALVINLRQPFLDRERRSHQARVLARLSHLIELDFDYDDRRTVAEEVRHTVIGYLFLTPPPLVGARTTTAPPPSHASISRLKELIST